MMIWAVPMYGGQHTLGFVELGQSCHNWDALRVEVKMDPLSDMLLLFNPSPSSL